MPALIANLLVMLRYVVIAIVQSAIFTAFLTLLEPLMNKLKEGVQATFSLSEEDSRTYVANFILDTAELAGLTVISLKTKFPLKVADKFGLTGRNWKRGALPAKVSSGANSPGAMAQAAKAKGVPTAAVAADAIGKARGVSASLVSGVYNKILGFVGVSSVAYLGFINTLDFAAWDGSAYQSTFQPIFAAFGISPDKQLAKATTVSDDVWTRVYGTYVNIGAYAISDPYKQQTVIFSKQALIDLVNKVGAELNATQGSAPAKAVLAATHALVRVKGSAPVYTPAPSTGGGGSTSGGSYTPPAPTVFTGIVTSGALGDASNFVARPDDLITDIKDMEAAMRNNLAPFLASLPGRVVYEVKVVPSYITKDGTTVRGVTQTVPNGTYANGTPKTKSVTNKFAIAHLYVVTSKGTRTKIDQIVLGPVDAVRFQPQQADLTTLETSVKKTIVTSYPNAKDVDDQEGEEEEKKKDDEPTVEEKRISRDETLLPGNSLSFKQTGKDTLYQYEGKYYYPSTQFRGTMRPIKPGSTLRSEINRGKVKVVQLTKEEYIPEPNSKDSHRLWLEGKWPPKEKAPLPPPPPPPPPRPANLTEFFALTKDPLPSIQERAALYDKYGLGSYAYYTGTAEQNEKLLTALLAQGTYS